MNEIIKTSEVTEEATGKLGYKTYTRQHTSDGGQTVYGATTTRVLQQEFKVTLYENGEPSKYIFEWRDVEDITDE